MDRGQLNAHTDQALYTNQAFIPTQRSGTQNVDFANQSYHPEQTNSYESYWETGEPAQSSHVEYYPPSQYKHDEYTGVVDSSLSSVHGSSQDHYYQEVSNNAYAYDSYSKESYIAPNHKEAGSTTPLRDESASNIRQDADIDYRPEIYQTYRANYSDHAQHDQMHRGYVTCKNRNMDAPHDD